MESYCIGVQQEANWAFAESLLKCHDGAVVVAVVLAVLEVAVLVVKLAAPMEWVS